MPPPLADKPVAMLWGVGAAMQRRLAADGVTLIGQLACSANASSLPVTAGSARGSPGPWPADSGKTPSPRHSGAGKEGDRIK
jgi:hypothetical protein